MTVKVNPDHLQNKIILILGLWSKYHVNLRITFSARLHTDRQTDRRDHITSSWMKATNNQTSFIKQFTTNLHRCNIQQIGV